MLKIELVRMVLRHILVQTWPNEHNIMQHLQTLDEKVDHFQLCRLQNIKENTQF